MIADSLNRAKAEEARNLIEEATRAAVSFDDYGPFINMIERAEKDKVTGDTVKVLEAVGDRVGLTKAEIEKLPVHFLPDERSRLGVNSAITSLAQEAKSYDRRIELEKAGGKVLNMPQRTWEAMAALA